MKILYVIPARGGSKGIPRKNIKLLNGKPLIYYTIDAVRELSSDENICISTDDEEIKAIVEKRGLKVPFIRPAELATDRAATYDVLLHALDFYEKKGCHPEILVLLQPTSPLRTSTHIKEALELYSNNMDMIVSVKETNSNPYYLLHEENEDGFLIKSKECKATRRQDVPKVWELNGAVYIINVNSLKSKNISEFQRVKKYVMDDLHSFDIDTLLDFEIVELILRKKLNK